MAKDDQGNDLQSVGIVLTGQLAYAPIDQENVPTSEEFSKPSYKLPEAFIKLGLLKSDGGAQDDSDQDDAIEFFQDGYKMAGDGTRTTEVNLAQNDDDIQRLINGKEPDENGVYYIDSITPDSKFILYQETVYKNKDIRRRLGVARISAIKLDQEERGSVAGSDVTFEWTRDELLNRSYYMQITIHPDES